MYNYPVDIIPNGVGGYIIQFPDVPEALTETDDKNELLSLAKDALLTILLEDIRNNKSIPIPSLPKQNQLIITISLKDLNILSK